MEGAHYTRGEEILVQYRDEAELLGDTRGLQECTCSNSCYPNAFYTVSCVPVSLDMADIP